MSIPLETSFSKKQNLLLTNGEYVKSKLKTSDKNILQMNQTLITI